MTVRGSNSLPGEISHKQYQPETGQQKNLCDKIMTKNLSASIAMQTWSCFMILLLIKILIFIYEWKVLLMNVGGPLWAAEWC